MKKHSKTFTALVIISIIACVYGLLYFTGILDGVFLELDGDTIFGYIIFAILGLLNIICLLLPIWYIYFYIHIAIKLHKAGNKKKFYLWLISVPIITAILIALAVYFYILTHQINGSTNFVGVGYGLCIMLGW